MGRDAEPPSLRSDLSLSTPRRFDRYEALRVLGRGGMGTVYEAKDPLIERKVAIKEIRADQIDDEVERTELEARFRLEFRSAGTLSHPNIVTIYDVGQEGGSYFIAMEYVGGMSLARRLKEQPTPPFEEIARLATQIASGLDYAHEQGIVHRDVKPGNVLLTRDGRPKITDFGLARWRTSELTMTGTVLGTPAYMSPEQVTGQELDGKSDQFSFAIILYLMLTGDPPFHGEHPSTILYKIVHEQPSPPREINQRLPAGVDRILSRALAKKPEHRYPSCSALATDLRTALLEEPTVPRPRSNDDDRDGREVAGGKDAAALDEPASGTGDVTLAATPSRLRPAKPRRRGGAVTRWLAGGLFIAAIGALAYWASLRRQAPPEPRPDAVAGVALDEGTAEGVAEGTASGDETASTAAEAEAEATTAPPATSSRVRLTVTSAPEGATIRLGGRDTGLLTPAEVELDADSRHVLELTLAGHAPAGWSFGLEELSDEQRACACLHFPLKSSKPPGVLIVNAPYPLSLEVAGRRHGPFTRGEVPVVAGRHQITLLAEDVFLRQTSKVEIGSGERRTLRVPKAVAVRITANPANCEVSVDGVYLDVTPINDRRMAVGTHEFSFYWPALKVRKPIRRTVSREGQRISATPN